MNSPPLIRKSAALVTAALILAACGGNTDSGDAPEPAGGAPAGGDDTEQLEEGAVPPTGVEGGPEFDLSGTEVVATTSPPGAINMGTFFVYKRLEEWGADIETVIVTTTSGVQTIMAGRADIASQGSDEVVLGAAEGADMVAVGAPSTAMDYVLVATEDIESVEALEGKTIGMSGPSGFDALLSRFSLEDVGLSGNDVNFVQIGGSPDRAAALLSGQVDAATVFLEDWEELSRKTDELRLVQYMAEIVPEFPATAYFGQASFWEENPDLPLALACANLQANAWINSSEDEYVEYVLQVVPGATEEAARAIYQGGQEVNMWPTNPDEVFSVDGLGGLVDAMVETGDISEPVDPEQIADVSYLQEAADMGCNEL
ncbi:MAG: PhnD/SsuA/transferrin family substrate-binding protein [Propionibacteriales bacterium]|nr:PhnD/SsuA/transferrin family substrate-binding protein [Propionibacteriales bacterium]